MAEFLGTTFRHAGTQEGFYGASAVAKPTVSGARDANAAVASLLSALATLGLVTDSTSAGSAAGTPSFATLAKWGTD